MTRIGAEQTTGSLVVMLFLLGFFREIVANDRYPRAAVSYISFSSSSGSISRGTGTACPSFSR